MKHFAVDRHASVLSMGSRVALVCCGTLVFLLLTSCLLVAEPSKVAATWPQFRGPGRDGASPDKGLLAQWPEGGPRKVWEATGAGLGYSTVVVVGNRFYTMGARDDKEYVLAFDLATGKKVWEQINGAKFGNDRGAGPRGTPTIDGKFLYALGANGDLCCLELDKGAPVWQRNVLKIFKGAKISWGLSESVLVDGDRVICMPGGPDASVVALNKKNGELIWQSTGLSHRAAYASAVPFKVDNIRGIVNFTHEALVGIDVASGKTLWTFPKAANGTANCATPIVDGNFIYMTSDYGTGGGLVELSKDGKDGVKATEVYFNKDMQNHHGGVVLVDGAIYGTSGNGGRGLRFVCMDFKTGKVHWKQENVGKASLIYADGHLYCLTIDGKMTLVEANKEKYVEKGRFVFKTYGDGEFKTGGIQETDQKPTWCHPVVVGKKLFLRDQDRIVCYDVAAK